MKSHRTDPIALVFGLLFLALAAWWPLAQVIDVTPARVGWAGAITLVGLGVIGIVTSIVGNRPERPEQSDESSVI